jgi:polar amino acid transport system substrate-binding protein
VTFSSGYYNVQQSIIALKGSKIVKTTPRLELKTYLYGDQIGTTGLAYIDQVIKPDEVSPRVYSTRWPTPRSALETGQIDAIVSTPRTVSTWRHPVPAKWSNAKGKTIAVQVGQFPSVGEHYGLLFKKGNKLVGCVNAAIAAIKSNGTLGAADEVAQHLHQRARHQAVTLRGRRHRRVTKSDETPSFFAPRRKQLLLGRRGIVASTVSTS